MVRALFTYPCIHSLLIHSTPVDCTLTVCWALLWRRLRGTAVRQMRSLSYWNLILGGRNRLYMTKPVNKVRH